MGSHIVGAGGLGSRVAQASYGNGSRLLSIENSNFPYFSVSFTFQHEIPY